MHLYFSLRSYPALASVLLLLASFPALASPPSNPESPLEPALSSLDSQRQLYNKALSALKKRDYRRFHIYRKQLTSYPLYPYLEYHLILKHDPRQHLQQITDFLKKYPDMHLHDRLRRITLKRLARHKQWQEYIKLYGSENHPVELQCHYRRALLETGRIGEAFRNFDSLWTTGNSLPRSCDTLIKHWKKTGKPDRKTVWLRIQVAMELGKARLARFLGRKYLPGNEQKWMQQWYRAWRRPVLLLKTGAVSRNNPYHQEIIKTALRKLVRINSSEALKVWSRLKAQGRTSIDTDNYIVKLLALSLARRHDPAALDWLAKIPVTQVDENVIAWTIRSHLLKKNWPQVLTNIRTFPEPVRNSVQWQYWTARALEQTGKRKEADAIYQKLAETRSFEGFLVADRLGRKYSFNDKPLYFPATTIDNFLKNPALLRIRELLHARDITNARREWTDFSASLGTEYKKISAIIAHRWHWHERVIHVLGSIRYYDDINLRFPVFHTSDVNIWADKYKLNRALVLAIIRRESAFSPDARSHKGALGLMQLMPATARDIARIFRLRLRQTRNLIRPATNIKYGVKLLSHLRKKLDNNLVLMVAAYNAGAYRVNSWKPAWGEIDSDIWIETIPFTETRQYVKNVLAYLVIYEHRLQLNQKTSLHRVMTPK